MAAGAVLGECLGSRSGSALRGRAACSVPGVEGHEVLDVGGDQGALGGRRASENLATGSETQSWVGDDGQHVVSLSAEPLGDESESISSSSSGSHVLTPRAGRVRDARLAWPHPRLTCAAATSASTLDRRPDRMAREAGAARCPCCPPPGATVSVPGEVGPAARVTSDRTDDLPDVRPGSQRRATTGRAGPEDDTTGMLTHSRASSTSLFAADRWRHAGVGGGEGGQPPGHGTVESHLGVADRLAMTTS